MKTIRLKTEKIVQPIGSFYCAKINGVKLYNLAKADILRIPQAEIDENEEIDVDGVQRNLIESKVKRIESYLSYKNSTFPNSIILNISSDKVIDINDDYIEFIDSKDTFEIIDGQHRLAGFRNIKDKDIDFELVVSIFINLSQNDMHRMFATINTEQTKVDPSRNLFVEYKDIYKTPRKIAVELAITFNIDKESPWNGKIKTLGKKDFLSPDATLSLSAFCNPIIDFIYNDKKDLYLIRNILESNNNNLDKLIEIEYDKNKYIFWELYLRNDHKVIYKILFNYFTAIKTILISEWDNPASLLVKTTGYNALMELFHKVFILGMTKGDLSYDYFLSILNKLSVFNGKVNTTFYGASGLASSRKLLNDFLYELNL